MNDMPKFFDELQNPDGSARDAYSEYHAWFENEDLKRLRKKSLEAETFFRRTGITFNVYGQAEADERLIPFDIVPRIISGREWARLTKGIEQRVRAINAFLYDIYHRQEILRAGRVPADLIARGVIYGGLEFEMPMVGEHTEVFRERARSPVSIYGTAYLWTAGLMNLLLLFDVWDIGRGRKA